jgi:hypothetical protein
VLLILDFVKALRDGRFGAFFGIMIYTPIVRLLQVMDDFWLLSTQLHDVSGYLINPLTNF